MATQMATDATPVTPHYCTASLLQGGPVCCATQSCNMNEGAVLPAAAYWVLQVVHTVSPAKQPPYTLHIIIKPSQHILVCPAEVQQGSASPCSQSLHTEACTLAPLSIWSSPLCIWYAIHTILGPWRRRKSAVVQHNAFITGRRNPCRKPR